CYSLFFSSNSNYSVRYVNFQTIFNADRTRQGI
ncbi:hypothetical protein A5848_000434, partial [Enterococcus faecium]